MVIHATNVIRTDSYVNALTINYSQLYRASQENQHGQPSWADRELLYLQRGQI